MSAITAPGVYVQTVAPPATLNPVAVDVAAFLGVFERGPLDTPTRVASWPQVQATFGDFILNGIGAYALKGWLDNGGRAAHVVRVAAPQRVTKPLGSQPADRQSSVLEDLTGFVIGAGAAVQQNGGTWLYLAAAIDLLTGTVTWDRPLHPQIDITLSFSVTTGASSASTTLVDDGGTPVLEVSASSPGAWGNELTVLVDARAPAATVSVPVPVASASATAVASCNGFASHMLALITQVSGGVVLGERHVVVGVSTSPPALEWDSPLTVVDPSQPMRIEAQTFALSVRRSGTLVEVHDQLTVVPASPAFAPTAVNGSSLITCSIPAAAALHPPPATGNPVPGGWIALVAGLDGTAALGLPDLLGNEAAGVLRGLASLSTVDEPAIICAPDLVAQPVAAQITLPPTVTDDPCCPCPPAPPPPDQLVATISEASARFSQADIATAQQAIVQDCQDRGDRLALIDPPCGQGPLDVPTMITWRTRFSSSYAAMYVPWVTVLDPLATTPGHAPPPWGTMRRLPPSGHVSGLMAQIDASVGPWQSPANKVLAWVHQSDLAIDDTAHGLLNAAGVDALRPLPGRGVSVLGARTVSGDPAWIYVSTRRLFLMLERTLRVGLSWCVFEPAGPTLQKTMVAAINGLLLDLFQQGAFGGDTAQQAFAVQYDAGNALIGEVLVDILVQPKPPAEVILLQVLRTENQLQLREQPKQGSN